MRYFFLGILIFLAGCSQNTTPKNYDYVDLSESKKVIYFRNCNIASLFKSRYIKFYKNGQIYDSNISWDYSVANRLFNNMLKEGSKAKLKFTRLPDLYFLDCYIEQLFFNEEKKQVVVSATVRFGQNIKAFHIVYILDNLNNEELIGMEKLLEKLAEQIVIFVSKNFKS